MPLLELWLWVGTLACFAVGLWGICWVKTAHARAGSGRRLYIGALIALGITVFVSALHRASGLAPQGLTAGFLLVGMLWESPVPLTEPAN